MPETPTGKRRPCTSLLITSLRKSLDAEISNNWSLTQELFKNHSLQRYFDNDDSLRKKGTEFNEVSDNTPKMPEPRFPYPRISDLSIEEQKHFLNTYKEYVCGKDIGSCNLDTLQNLMWRLSAEQEEFLWFLQLHSVSARDDYNFLHSQARKEIEDVLQDQRRQLQQSLDPLYSLFQTVSLSSGAVFPNDPILTYNKTLKQRVGQCLLLLPDMKKERKSLLESRETPLSTRCPIWHDSVAKSFSHDSATHFVITAGGLQTLIDNHPPEYEKDWELPVTVIQLSKDANCPKTIMIDDPLPPKSVKPREANVMYYVSKVRDILRKDNQGVSPVEDRLGQHVKNVKESDEVTDTTGEEVRSLDDDVAFESKDFSKGNQPEPSQFTYSVWTFGNLNLLIRTDDCGLLYQTSKTGIGSLHPVNVFVKPEYQLTYGYEQITMSEASRWWIKTYINPDSLCVCARIDPVTAQLLRVDVLNQASILNLASFDPAKPMKMIHGILTRLEKLLKPGKYVLCHSTKDLHLCVYEMVDSENGGQGKKASYNLHLAHSIINTNSVDNYEKAVPWVPLDPNMFLDWHIAYHRIPLTFPPIPKEELKKMRKPKVVVGKKKKGRKAKLPQNLGFKSERRHESKPVMNVKKLDKQSLSQSRKQTEEHQEERGLSTRLRSRATPVTYDDIDFDF